MNVIKNEMHVMFDVDDTLVMWNEVISSDTEWIMCPHTLKCIPLIPHKAHIDLLHSYYSRGYYVTVWSAGGWEWAEAVVKHLKLQDSVHEVRSKPIKYVDDLPANEILGTRVYINYIEPVTYFIEKGADADVIVR